MLLPSFSSLSVFETNAVLVKRTLAVSFIELPYKLLLFFFFFDFFFLLIEVVYKN